MDEARSVLERLERVRALDGAGAEPGELLVELRALLAEAENWAAAEGGDAGERAVARLRDSLAHDMIVV
ncbi:MAG: hypothetical protein ACRDPZ_06420 [Gaiellaceae bacterium]